MIRKQLPSGACFWYYLVGLNITIVIGTIVVGLVLKKWAPEVPMVQIFITLLVLQNLRLLASFLLHKD